MLGFGNSTNRKNEITIEICFDITRFRNRLGYQSEIGVRLFLVNDLQTPSPFPPLKNSGFDLLVQIVEKRSETIENGKKNLIFFLELS